MPLSRPRRNRHAKRKLHPAWEALLHQRITAAVNSGRPLIGGVGRGSASRSYSEGSFADALRAGEVTLDALLASSEVCASPGTVTKWRRIAAALDTAARGA